MARTAGLVLVALLLPGLARAQEESTMQKAPLFTATTHEGTPFSLAERQGKGWTVLFFYPKADTPGCTRQACAFRDSIRVIRELGAEVYGISGDTIEDQAAFHAKHHLTFTLLADPAAEVISAYGAKYPLLKVARRWTFVLDPELRIRWVDKDVDPMLDARRVAEQIRALQGGQPTP
jgi:peroxiredoxin Q/BCP